VVPFIFLLSLNFQEKEAKGVPALPQTSTTMEEKTHLDLVKGSSILSLLSSFTLPKSHTFIKNLTLSQPKKTNINLHFVSIFHIFKRREQSNNLFFFPFTPDDDMTMVMVDSCGIFLECSFLESRAITSAIFFFWPPFFLLLACKKFLKERKKTREKLLTCCNSFRKVYYLELSLRVACKE